MQMEAGSHLLESWLITARPLWTRRRYFTRRSSDMCACAPPRLQLSARSLHQTSSDFFFSGGFDRIRVMHNSKWIPAGCCNVSTLPVGDSVKWRCQQRRPAQCEAPFTHCFQVKRQNFTWQRRLEKLKTQLLENALTLSPCLTFCIWKKTFTLCLTGIMYWSLIISCRLSFNTE